MYQKNHQLRQNVLACLIWVVQLFALAGCASAPEVKSSGQSMALFSGLGGYHFPVSTKVRDAQRYFDQGLILAFGFNHTEAANSFREAYRLDPDCALCYWGEALVLGPNINAPMVPADVPLAYAAVQRALVLSAKTTGKERALITALTKRYGKLVLENRKPLDEAYAAAMRATSRQFPDDALIASLYAEALMDLHPWNFWSKQGEARPWTAEIISTLERALALDADHPLANHLYIHALEASPHAAKAIPSARRLATLVPASGHLVHMPAHIYIRTGLYRDAILANQQAVKVDRDYLNHAHVESLYTIAYVPHNHHFIWAAAIKTGQRQLAMNAATDAAHHVKRELLQDPAIGGTLQHFSLLPLYTKAAFGQWDAVLAEPEPPDDLLYPAGIRHYARGLAWLRKGHADAARRELERLEMIIQNPAIGNLTIFDLNPVKPLLEIAEAILRGELAAQNNDLKAAISHLQRAAELEDGLNYTEPKDWYLPPRQVLGEVLLKAGRAGEAEKVYRQDLQYHPQNGWSLFGLARSLTAQNKITEADSVMRQYKDVWADADVVLSGSKF